MAKKITGGSKNDPGDINRTGRGAKNNPRYKNGALRRKHRARLKAQGGPCGICKGRFGEIHYDEPSNWKYPLSFVVDEIIPVSRWKEYGYDSPEAVAQDWNNLQPAHYCCNQAKSNKVISARQINYAPGNVIQNKEKRMKPIEGQKKYRGATGNEHDGEDLGSSVEKIIFSKINLSDGSW